MRTSVEIIALQPRHVFRISRGAKDHVRNVIFKVSDGHFTGLGEASPNAFYHESADDVAALLRDISEWMTGVKISQPGDITALWPEIWNRVQPSRAAACAIELALWDWLARSRAVSLCELLWGTPFLPVTSCVTLGLSTPEELDEKLREFSSYPLLKVKLSQDHPLETVTRIRERSDARLVVDANADWDANLLEEIAPSLANLGVEFIEQPLPPGDVFNPTQMPIFADESCVVPEDVAQLPESFAGFNIKLVKCGGITPALEMLALAKQRGFRTMTGCMLESSVLIAAGAAIAQKTDYADLDGSWLLRDEPFGRVHFRHGILTV